MEQNKIIIYQTGDGQTQVDVRLENDTVWLVTIFVFIELIYSCKYTTFPAILVIIRA